jgi:hypothetical protein
MAGGPVICWADAGAAQKAAVSATRMVVFTALLFMQFLLFVQAVLRATWL